MIVPVEMQSMATPLVAIPVGYKQTEVGVIPEDWGVCELQNAVEFLDGQRRPIKSGDRAKIAGIYPYYGASGIVDYVNDYIFDEELILLGEDGENILSRNVPLAFKVSGKIWVNNHAHVLRPQKSFHISFLTEFLESLDYSLLNSGTAQPKLNKQTCQKIKIIKPRHEEQTAIAKVLSDTDALITGLEQLVAKKQAIKTAAMQQLLTGRTRLPQFALRPDGTPKGYRSSELGQIPEDWTVCCLDDRANFIGSGKTSTKSSGEYPLYGSTGLIGTCKNSDYEGEAILVARVGANAGKLNFVVGEYGVSDNTLLIKLKTENSIQYLKYLLTRMNLNSLVFGSGQPLITGTQLKELLLALPLFEEQTAIATILSNMDKELAVLEQKLVKTRVLKQGMMQQLLTGKIRLPLPKEM